MPALSVVTHTTGLRSVLRGRRCQSRSARGRIAHSPPWQNTNRDQQTGPAVATIPSRHKFRSAHDALALQEFPEMPLGESNCPAQIGKGDPLGGASLTELKITFLDVVARLGEQPLAKVPQDFLESSPQFLDRDFAQIGGARGSFQFRDQLGARVRRSAVQSYVPTLMQS